MVGIPTSKEIKVGDKVRYYNMWTKRYKTIYVVRVDGERVGISKIKGGGEAGSLPVGDIEKVGG